YNESEAARSRWCVGPRERWRCVLARTGVLGGNVTALHERGRREFERHCIAPCWLLRCRGHSLCASGLSWRCSGGGILLLHGAATARTECGRKDTDRCCGFCHGRGNAACNVPEAPCTMTKYSHVETLVKSWPIQPTLTREDFNPGIVCAPLD